MSKSITDTANIWPENITKSISISEVGEAVAQAKNNKAPGIDGIPVDFYKCFPKTYTILRDFFQETLENGSLPATHAKSVIALIYKKRDKTLIQNYRPISLLCADIKLLSRIIANRLKSSLQSVIHPDQQGFCPNSDIKRQIFISNEIMDFCDKEEIEGWLLLVDFEKAFDSVSHQFLFEALEIMGLPAEFIGWLKILYSNCKATVMINGNLSEEFRLQSGVKQGDPLSPYLFICVMEALAALIRSRAKELGIETPKGIISILLFADDVSLPLKNKQAVLLAADLLEDFCEASGMKINNKKTILLRMGKAKKIKRKSFRNKPFKIATRDHLAEYLGSVVGSPKTRRQIFDPKIEKIERSVRTWKNCYLTLYGKKLVINAILGPKIYYRAHVEYIDMFTLNKLCNIWKGFIWPGRPKIAWNTLVRPPEELGLGLACPKVTTQAGYAKWIRDFFAPKNEKLTLVKMFKTHIISFCKKHGVANPLFFSTYGTKKQLPEEGNLV